MPRITHDFKNAVVLIDGKQADGTEMIEIINDDIVRDHIQDLIGNNAHQIIAALYVNALNECEGGYVGNLKN